MIAYKARERLGTEETDEAARVHRANGRECRTNCSELAEKYMNRWNRLFVVIAVCWAIVSPFLVAREANRVPELTFHNCADPLTKNTGQVTRLCLI